jgi:hypothetical protein
MPLIKSAVDKSDLERLYQAIKEKQSAGGSLYPGMTYEDGIEAVLDLLDGNATLQDIYETIT